jgi:hypothetical protein
MGKHIRFPLYGWLGLALAGLGWALNWSLEGIRTHFLFFPMWLGYCLAVDGLVYLRRGTSLFTRSWKRYLGLFLISAPVWWLFELFNLRLQNWAYLGSERFTPLEFWFWSTLNFTIVMPAVFGSAELAASFPFLQRLVKGPVIRPDRSTTLAFFSLGWGMLVPMLLWPKAFFPFVWLSVYFILEPVNVWLRNHHLADGTGRGDWRPVIALWLGVLLTGFYWELWNYYSYPKWIYHIPWGDFLHIFEMPLLGYFGYLPFALELHALYYLIAGAMKDRAAYLQIEA